jgi:hypothetical protein
MNKQHVARCQAERMRRIRDSIEAVRLACKSCEKFCDQAFPATRMRRAEAEVGTAENPCEDAIAYLEAAELALDDALNLSMAATMLVNDLTIYRDAAMTVMIAECNP